MHGSFFFSGWEGRGCWDWNGSASKGWGRTGTEEVYYVNKDGGSTTDKIESSTHLCTFPWALLDDIIRLRKDDKVLPFQHRKSQHCFTWIRLHFFKLISLRNGESCWCQSLAKSKKKKKLTKKRWHHLHTSNISVIISWKRNRYWLFLWKDLCWYLSLILDLPKLQ